MSTITIPGPNNEMIEVSYNPPIQISSENLIYSGSIPPSGIITTLSL